MLSSLYVLLSLITNFPGYMDKLKGSDGLSTLTQITLFVNIKNLNSEKSFWFP